MTTLDGYRQKIIRILAARKNQTALDGLAAILIGTIAFLILFGIHTLNPANVDWIYIRGGDMLQHQLGWMAFRAEPWSLKIGWISSLLYPTGTSIVYTDSIPLLAVFFKLFRAWLPEPFQYFGIWTLVNWILTAWFSILLFSRLNLSRLSQYGGAILFTISPVLIDRAFHHDGLIAQWLILAAFTLLINHLQTEFPFKGWIALVVISLWIHAYLFVMVVAFYSASLLFEWIHTRSWKRVLLNLTMTTAICLASAWMLGMFDAPSQMRSKNIAHYSANMNALVNPVETSRFLDALPFAYDGQYEGYAYLGVGGFLLAAVALLAGGRPRWNRTQLKYLTLVLPALALAVLSCGGTITAGAHVLYKIPIPGFMEDVFLALRSNGRFIWPLYYLILVFLLVRLNSTGWLRWLLPAMVLIQFIDIQPLISSKSYITKTGYQSPLTSSFWRNADGDYKHIFIFPEDDTLYFYPPFGLYAIQHHMTINWMYLARADYRWLDRYAGDVLEELTRGEIDPGTLYIASDKRVPNTLKRTNAPGILVCPEAGYWMIVKEPTDLGRSIPGLETCAPASK